MRFIDVLLRNQVGLLLEHLGQARVHEVRFVVGRLRADDLLLGALDGGGRLLELSLQLRELQDREHFSSLHPIADVHFHLPDIAGDSGVHVDFLERTKLGREIQCVDEVRSA